MRSLQISMFLPAVIHSRVFHVFHWYNSIRNIHLNFTKLENELDQGTGVWISKWDVQTWPLWAIDDLRWGLQSKTCFTSSTVHHCYVAKSANSDPCGPGCYNNTVKSHEDIVTFRLKSRSLKFDIFFSSCILFLSTQCWPRFWLLEGDSCHVTNGRYRIEKWACS